MQNVHNDLKGRNRGLLAQRKMLYDMLMGRKSGYEGILEALLQTNQSVAYKILSDGKHNFEKSSQDNLHISLPESIIWQKKYITENLPILIKVTSPNRFLLDCLLSHSVISEADAEYISSVVKKLVDKFKHA